MGLVVGLEHRGVVGELEVDGTARGRAQHHLHLARHRLGVELQRGAGGTLRVVDRAQTLADGVDAPLVDSVGDDVILGARHQRRGADGSQNSPSHILHVVHNEFQFL